MPRGKKAEAPKANLGTYKGRTIRRQLVSLGIGGEIVLNEDDPALPMESTVTFQATAEVGAEKFKVRPDGGIDEFVILTLTAKSFQVLSVEEKTPDPQLPGIDGEDMGEDPTGPPDDGGIDPGAAIEDLGE